MDDLDENAVMVNAIQRHARVVVQKSIAEGFGLTVAEAMWKGRPGRRLQSRRHRGPDRRRRERHSRSTTRAISTAFGRAVADLLADPQRAELIGRGARERVRDRFLSVRSLLDYLAVIRRILAARSDESVSG